MHIDLIPSWSIFCVVGFSVHIQPDVHLDEQIPICARDQHLLHNIFGDKWKSPVVISAYTAIKGQTGYMQNWLPKQWNTVIARAKVKHSTQSFFFSFKFKQPSSVICLIFLSHEYKQQLEIIPHDKMRKKNNVKKILSVECD